MATLQNTVNTFCGIHFGKNIDSSMRFQKSSKIFSMRVIIEEIKYSRNKHMQKGCQYGNIITEKIAKGKIHNVCINVL